MSAVATTPAIVLPGAPCAHCGLPVPASLQRAEGEQFCCAGCEAARGAILSCGLDAYYRLRDDATPARERAADATDTSEALFDDPAFTSRFVRVDDDIASCRLYVEGVHCIACLWLLERLPTIVDGLLSVELDLSRAVATVRWRPESVRLSEIARAIARFGYGPKPYEASDASQRRTRASRRALAEIGVAAACMGNAMLLALAMYSGEVAPLHEALFRWLSLALGLTAAAWPGRVFFKGAIAALRMRTWHLDMPIAIALAGGVVAGGVNVVRGTGEIYFDSLTMLIFLLLIGRWLQSRQQMRATDAVEVLYSLTPRTVRLVDGDDVRVVNADRISVGDLVEVLPDHCVPVDGMIESGHTTIDESILTGESRPVEREPGAEVFAGSSNLSRAIRVRASASGEATRIGRIAASIENMSRARVPIVGSAERLAKPFVIAVVSLGLLTLAIHAASGVETAASHAVALLIVVCPCALALATPLAVGFSIGKLARRGILVKGGDIIEALAGAPRVIFDKTGTLTDGHYTLREWIGDPAMQPVAAALESGSVHPVASAIRDGVDAGDMPLSDVVHHPAMGVSGTLRGERVAVGSHRLMDELGVDTSLADSLEERALTRVLVARDDKVVAVALLGEAVREGAADSISTLRSRDWSVSIASGDAASPVRRVAEELGVDEFRASMSPEQKHDLVRAQKAGGRVVFVGDGVNDAAALSEADVGIAVHGGAEASLAAADVYLSRSGVEPVLELVDTCRDTTRRVRLCLMMAASYNAVAGTLAVMGIVSPLLAAVLMPISSLSVLAVAGAGLASRTENVA